MNPPEDGSGTGPLLAARAGYLIALAARAPSVHNTQPWRFTVTEQAIELYSDASRKVGSDPLGREMLISCGAALYGLRLGVRSLGYLPRVESFPAPGRLSLLARVRLGPPEPPTQIERRMLQAVPHRHTHRGSFAPEPLPAGLLAGLQHDAVAEQATLALAGESGYRKLAAIVGPVSSVRDQDPRIRAEVAHWTRGPREPARDGVPAHAFASRQAPPAGRLPQRDFDLGRGFGQLTADGTPPAATAVLVTTGDFRRDWLHAGQALYRLLLRAASQWVFASLYTQRLAPPAIRAEIRHQLKLTGTPQVLLQLGTARTVHTTARRPVTDLTGPG